LKHPGESWRVAPGHHVSLAKCDPTSTPGCPGDRLYTEALIPQLHDKMFALQDRLWAEARRSLLVVLQGMDAAGKDGTIKHVFGGVNPQGTHVTSFKQPSAEEQAHDFLWRVHQHAPRGGEIGIFNRSHYEDVLVTRVEHLVDESVWRERYDHINAFERLLAHGGTTIVKLFLHISRDEQARRLTERERWDGYQGAYTETIERTSTDTAAWYVVPANHKWYRNWAVSRILIETLEQMDPQYPVPAPIETGTFDGPGGDGEPSVLH